MAMAIDFFLHEYLTGGTAERERVVVEILTIMMLTQTGCIGLGYGFWDWSIKTAKRELFIVAFLVPTQLNWKYLQTLKIKRIVNLKFQMLLSLIPLVWGWALNSIRVIFLFCQ